uniref:hypothetical protein n=1 Tax=Bradyrhizobium sp. (strain ORS 278) TaxID=114615 RepID=UPI0002DFFFAD|nr:hypothetical protein [Bradyrhizobium sp. ORS 278]
MRQLQALLLTRHSVVVMSLASIALALASAERTFQGMRNFTGGATSDDQQFATVVSLLITVGVQILLVHLSWRIGDAYANDAAGFVAGSVEPEPLGWTSRVGQRIRRIFIVRHFVLILSFLICAFVCVFFSFDAFLQGISSTTQRAIVARGVASTLLLKINAEVGKDLGDQRDKAAADLSGGPAWNAYKVRIAQVVSAATAPELTKAADARVKQLAEEAKARADKAAREKEDRQREQNAAASKVSELSNESQRLEAGAKDAAQAFERAKQDRDKNLADIRQADADIARMQQQMDDEETTGRGTLNRLGNPAVGQGPRWRALNNSKQLLVKTKENLKAQTAALESAVTKAEQTSQQASEKFEKAKLDLSNAEAGLTSVKSVNEVATALQRGPDDITGNLSSASAAATRLSDLPKEFSNKRTWDSWTAIAAQCNRVISLLRGIPESRARAEKLSCDVPEETSTAVDAYFDLARRRDEFQQKCMKADTSTFSFQQLIDKGRDCLQIAGLHDDVTKALGAEIDRDAEEQDEHAHTFVRTISAFQRGDKLAYIAVAIALSLDGLIVLSGIWGARANASPLSRGKEIMIADVEEHARNVMAIEIRPDKLRPPAGWPVPPEVYKARLFLNQIEYRHDAAQPQFGGTISCAGLGEQERAAINSVLAIGAFAEPVEERPQVQIWRVTWRLIHFVTSIAAGFERVQRIRQAAAEARADMAGETAPAPVSVETLQQAGTESNQSYWARAAAAAKSGPPAKSETELTERGFVERAHEAFRDEVVSAELENDNSVVHPNWATQRKGREVAAG